MHTTIHFFVLLMERRVKGVTNWLCCRCFQVYYSVYTTSVYSKVVKIHSLSNGFVYVRLANKGESAVIFKA